jgi:hypothetical protein
MSAPPVIFQASSLTLGWAFEDDEELLHIVVDEGDFVVTHHQLHHVRLYSSLRTAHRASAPSERVKVDLVEWMRKIWECND